MVCLPVCSGFFLFWQMAKGMSPDQIVLVNLCGRGDKDMHTVAKYLGEDV